MCFLKKEKKMKRRRRMPGDLWGGWRCPSVEDRRRRRCSLCTTSTTENTEEERGEERANQRRLSVSSCRTVTERRCSTTSPPPLPRMTCTACSQSRVVRPAASHNHSASFPANGISLTSPVPKPSPPITVISTYGSAPPPPS